MEATRTASTRISMARLAERVIALEVDVSPVQGGTRWQTRDGERAIAGVTVVAAGASRVAVGLHLIAHLPPPPLERRADQIRQALARAATDAELGDRLGEVDVTFHDLRDPAEIEKPR